MYLKGLYAFMASMSDLFRSYWNFNYATNPNWWYQYTGHKHRARVKKNKSKRSRR